jgi:hypothetical protein
MNGDTELSLHDLVHQLNANKDVPHIVKALEAQHVSERDRML